MNLEDVGDNLEDVRDKIWESVEIFVHSSVSNSMWDSVYTIVMNSVRNSVKIPVGDSVDFRLQEPVRKERRIQERAGNA
jgi:hypothetical protein